MLDLLSDDDDSFFEDPKAKKKPPLQSKSQKSAVVQDLFGIAEEKSAPPFAEPLIKPSTSSTTRDSDWLGLGDDFGTKDDQLKAASKSSIASTPKGAGRISKKISFEDDDDLLGGLGFDNSSKKGGDEKVDFATKKSAILEDLLGETKHQQEDKKITFENILQSSRARKQGESVKSASVEVSSVVGSGDVRETPVTPAQKSQNISTGYAPSSSGREGRRSRAGPSNIMDPLGIFGSEKTPEKHSVAEPAGAASSRPNSLERSTPPQREKPMLTQKSVSLDLDSENSSVLMKPQQATNVPKTKLKEAKSASSPSLTLPDWLGGSNLKSTKQVEPSTNEHQRKQSISVAKGKPAEEEAIAEAPSFATSSFYNNPNQESVVNQQKLSMSNLELQNSQMMMQQQESQVLMALQLKKYEDTLVDMHRSQQELILKQEHQFNSLLERQLAKQQVMENSMRLQQERINNHMQLLLAQPSISVGGGDKLLYTDSEKQLGGEYKKEMLDNTDAEEYYKTVIDNLKQKHHEEMFLVDESYK